ncbi:hypothetical protein TNCV_1536841 [Trichonephila clavipes]|nr:hypothetical protein TNCV_1536841 [Trichonephila clavipes]
MMNLVRFDPAFADQVATTSNIVKTITRFGAKSRYVGCDAINVPVDVDTMVQQLLRQLDDDQAFNVNIKKNIIHKSTYLSSVVIKSMCDRSALESEVLLVRQRLAISETWMEDPMSVNVPGFDQRSFYNTAKRRQIATTTSVMVASSSSSRKAGGVAIYRNINSFTDCNRVNIDISEINLGMKDAKAVDVCLVKVKGIFKLILGCEYIHSGTALAEIKLFMLCVIAIKIFQKHR